MRVRFTLWTLLVVIAAVGVSAQTMESMTEGIVPVVVRQPGAMDSTWSTSVYVSQTTGPSAARVNFTIHNPAGSNWSLTSTLPAPMGSMEIADIVSSVSSEIPDGKYILSWWSTHPVVVSTRTFTTEAAGSYGQGITALARGSGFGEDGQVVFPAPMDFAGHRVNVGVANAGSMAQAFDIEAVDANGSVVSSWTRTVLPEAIDQFRCNDELSGVGSLKVKCVSGCDGNTYGYASVVVNDSNDAYFLYAAAEEGATAYPPVATTRDDRGVWFITGGDMYDVFEAMGYAVASDRLWQAETYRRQARGRLSEVLGPSQQETDVFMRTVGYSDEELERAFAKMDSVTKAMIQGYVDGFNRRIAEIRADTSLLPFEFVAIGLQLGIDFLPEDWTTSDVLAWAALLQRFFDPEGLNFSGPSTGQLDNAALAQALGAAYGAEGQNMFADLRWVNDPTAQTMIPSDGAAASVRPPLPGIDVTTLPDVQSAALTLRQRLIRTGEALDRIGARVKMGSYAWAVSGDKTASGNPTVYSGPQMGFSVPSIVLEGSIRGGGLNISGMSVPGIPGIIIGRTPHHAWSMQVGHAHTVDFYLEAPENVSLHRMETIKIAGFEDLTVPVFRSSHGPIIEPLPYDPQNPPATIVAWKSAHWDYEFDIAEFILGAARATSMDEFGKAIEKIAVSQHFCYADRDGNIAYWMSGRDPVRPDGVDLRFPLLGDGTQEWDPAILNPRPHDRNTDQGYYGGWNNKSSVGYDNPPNSVGDTYGPFHRAHVVDEYLAGHDDLTYEQIRDLALNIATTSSFHGGGNLWSFVSDDFRAAVAAGSNEQRDAAIALLDAWDGHFVDGGSAEWAAGTTLADAWVLMDRWIDEVVELTFGDEFDGAGLDVDDQSTYALFGTLLHALAGESSSVVNLYDWFQDRSSSGLPTTADGIIVQALDTVLASLGDRPWNLTRDEIQYRHDVLGITVATTPYASRSTYAHVVELGAEGPLRIESMFPLGESGTILPNELGQPVYDQYFLSTHDIFNAWTPRPFPLFD